jgi:hypothetical protein
MKAKSIEATVAALRRMTVTQLRQKSANIVVGCS